MHSAFPGLLPAPLGQDSPAMAAPPDRLLSELAFLVQRLPLCRTVEEIGEAVVSSLRLGLGADGVSYVLRSGDQCHYIEEDSVTPLWKGRRFSIQSCVSGWAMLHKEPVLIPDVYADARVPHSAYRHTFVRSLAMVPVQREDPIAAIGAFWASEYQASPVQLQVMQAAAEAAGLATARLRVRDMERQLGAIGEEAERHRRSQARFFASASHDLRQPMQALRLFMEVLKSRLERPENRKILDLADTALCKGETLVRQLVEVSHLDAGAVAPARQDFPIDDLLTQMCKEFLIEARSDGTRLQVSRCSAIVSGDEVLLGRILRNFLSNALRYAKGKRVLLGCRRHGNSLRVEVWDSGIGIADADQQAIFEDFYQVGNPERDAAAGVGLGLATVRRLAKLQGLEVGLNSTLGRGSMFHVTVPLARWQPRAA